MSLPISDVVDFLAAAGLGLVTGTSLFEGYMGDTAPWPDALEKPDKLAPSS